ncbi:VOC family protein [Mycobacterium sp. CBMA271]|nr:glyoxalase [Mycobacteroides sp. CBMA 326]MUM21639.1 VOC family protein [Mycobacteroides sp. CBMA 271]
MTALHGVIIDTPNRDEAKAAYARLFGVPDVHPQLELGLPSWASAPGLAFATESLDETARVLARRGLELTPSAGYRSGVANGLTYGFTLASPNQPVAEADAREIDHLVLVSPNRDRIIATLCGRLGFDLRLDRQQPWGVHQLFFRCAGLVVEVVLSGDDPAGPDALWGIAWRTADIEASHARLTAANVTISDIRDGHKPGTRVATVKDRGLAAPTILIEQR